MVRKTHHVLESIYLVQESKHAVTFIGEKQKGSRVMQESVLPTLPPYPLGRVEGNSSGKSNTGAAGQKEGTELAPEGAQELDRKTRT